MPDPKNSASPLQCAFRGPNQVEVPEADLRKAIAAAANAERTRWLTGAGKRRKEDDDTVFPFLVCTWLAGFDSTLQPDTLVALQSAVSAVTYGNLTNTGLNSAIQVFNTADAAFRPPGRRSTGAGRAGGPPGRPAVPGRWRTAARKESAPIIRRAT